MVWPASLAVSGVAEGGRLFWLLLSWDQTAFVRIIAAPRSPPSSPNLFLNPESPVLRMDVRDREHSEEATCAARSIGAQLRVAIFDSEREECPAAYYKVL